jgi:plastocyanin
MITLDSRSLRFGDCYAQTFPTAGEIRCVVTAPGAFASPSTSHHGILTIRVAESNAKSAKQKHHAVVVRRDGANLVPEPSNLQINAGDIVVWHTQDQSLAGFAVVGEGPKFHLNSMAFTEGAFYTHAFGLPGQYKWIDANSGRVGGVVDVKNPTVIGSQSHAKWLKTLEQPKTFEIAGNRIRPERVSIHVGQTVVWKIDRATGITITDARLVPAAAGKKA